jgi:hypothetical protein
MTFYEQIKNVLKGNESQFFLYSDIKWKLLENLVQIRHVQYHQIIVTIEKMTGYHLINIFLNTLNEAHTYTLAKTIPIQV